MHAFIDKQIEQGRYPSFSTRRTFLPLRSLLCLTNHGTALSLLSHVLSGHWVCNIGGYGYGILYSYECALMTQGIVDMNASLNKRYLLLMRTKFNM